MLIKDIKPITEVGTNLLDTDNFEQVIDGIIELPLQKACRIFVQKGIETTMSSANKNNVLNVGETPIEKQDISARNMQIGSEQPNFEDVVKGYAWIMINFDTLSDENKDWLFDLEARKGKDGR